MAYSVYDLKDTYDRIQEEKQIVIDQNCYFGAKVVRGAYLERERFLAAEQGYEDPINPTYESTGEMYNLVIDHMIDYVCSNDGRDGGHVVIATHNEVNRAYTNSGLSWCIYRYKISGLELRNRFFPICRMVFGMQRNQYKRNH